MGGEPNVRLVAFTLNRKLGAQAGFRRNEQLLALCPVEAVVAQGLRAAIASGARGASKGIRAFHNAGQSADSTPLA
jgi:hypothetical protein